MHNKVSFAVIYERFCLCLLAAAGFLCWLPDGTVMHFEYTSFSIGSDMQKSYWK